MFLVLENQLLDSAKIMCSHSPILSQSNRGIEPEFALALRRAYVNVRWLMAFVRIKVKPK